MAWIESHQELRNHPKTKRLARLLNISIAAAIGHLHMFWWWAMDYADNGDVSQYDPEDIADAGGWEGDAQTFLDAMINCGPGNRCGFIDRAENGMYIHDWDEYIGKLLERRQRNKESVHKSRNKNVGDTLATCNANVTPTNENVGDTLEATVPNRTVPTVPNQPNQKIKDTPPSPPEGNPRCAPSVAPLPPGGAAADCSETDDEDNDENPRAPSTAETESVAATTATAATTTAPDLNTRRFEEFWSMYPRKVGKELAKKTWKKLKPDAELFGEIIAAVGRAKTSGQWQRDGGRFIPNPATWLNQGRWEDELTPLQPLVQPVVTGFDPAGMVGFKNALDRYDKLAEVADEAVRE